MDQGRIRVVPASQVGLGTTKSSFRLILWRTFGKGRFVTTRYFPMRCHVAPQAAIDAEGLAGSRWRICIKTGG